MNYFTISDAPPKKGPTNIFSVLVTAYAGDADYYDSVVYLFETPEQLNEFIIEAIMVQSQFLSGRGGCQEMYDQVNYFSTKNCYEIAPADGHWAWFDMDKFPYDNYHEQNLTLDTIVITYFDSNGNSIPVDVNDPESLYEDMAALGNQHHLNDYNVWNKGNEGQDDIEAVEAEMLALYLAYRADAIALKLKYLTATKM